MSKHAGALPTTEASSVSPEACEALANRVLSISRVMPHSTLLSAKIDEKLDTWAVTGIPDQTGRVKLSQLLIGKKTLDYFGPNEIAAVTMHEVGHNCFTFFAPDSLYLDQGFHAAAMIVGQT